MPLQAGSRIGSLVVDSLIGSGGMGEVYRARDTKLGREVAVKVLPGAVAADPERLERFEREARLLASLNHPNIAQVHGVVENPAALIMELVEGEDLAQRLARGPMPIETTSSSGSGPRDIRCARSSPSTSSITRARTPPDSSRPWICAM